MHHARAGVTKAGSTKAALRGMTHVLPAAAGIRVHSALPEAGWPLAAMGCHPKPKRAVGWHSSCGKKRGDQHSQWRVKVQVPPCLMRLSQNGISPGFGPRLITACANCRINPQLLGHAQTALRDHLHAAELHLTAICRAGHRNASSARNCAPATRHACPPHVA